MWKLLLSGFTCSEAVQELGTRGERLKAGCRMSDLCSVFALLPKQISCWGKLPAPGAGEIRLL